MKNKILNSLERTSIYINKLKEDRLRLFKDVRNIKGNILNFNKYKGNIIKLNKLTNSGEKSFNNKDLSDFKKTLICSYDFITKFIILLRKCGVYIGLRERERVKKVGLIIEKLNKIYEVNYFIITYKKHEKIIYNDLFLFLNKELSNLDIKKVSNKIRKKSSKKFTILYKIINTGLNNLTNIAFENTIEVNNFNLWYNNDEIDLNKLDKYIINLTKKNKYNISIYICLKTLYLNLTKFNKHVIINENIVRNLNPILLLKIAKLLIFIFLKTENIIAITELYKIDKIIYNDVEITEKVLNYYIQIKDYEKSENILDHLIEIEPYHPLLKNYSFEIQKLKAYDKIKSSSTIQIDNLNELSGREFEELIKIQFIKLGYKTETTKNTGDYGADLIIETKKKTRVAVQCKRFKSKVNLKAIQEVVGAISYYCCDTGIVITNSSFFKSAINLAESNEIELWDHSKLLLFLSDDISFSELKKY